jgi:hypothetical protein
LGACARDRAAVAAARLQAVLGDQLHRAAVDAAGGARGDDAREQKRVVLAVLVRDEAVGRKRGRRARLLEAGQLERVVDHADLEVLLEVEAAEVERDLVGARRRRRIRARARGDRVGGLVDDEAERERLLHVELGNAELQLQVGGGGGADDRVVEVREAAAEPLAVERHVDALLAREAHAGLRKRIAGRHRLTPAHLRVDQVAGLRRALRAEARRRRVAAARGAAVANGAAAALCGASQKTENEAREKKVFFLFAFLLLFLLLTICDARGNQGRKRDISSTRFPEKNARRVRIRSKSHTTEKRKKKRKKKCFFSFVDNEQCQIPHQWSGRI